MGLALYSSRVRSSDLLDECPRFFHSPYANPSPSMIGVNRNRRSHPSGGLTLSSSRPSRMSVIGRIAPVPMRRDTGHEHHIRNDSEVNAYCLNSPKHAAPMRAAPPPTINSSFVRPWLESESRASIQKESQEASNSLAMRSTGRSHSGKYSSRRRCGTGIRLTIELSGARADVRAWHFIPHASAPAIC